MDWKGEEITKVAEIIEAAETLVIRDKENHLLRDYHLYEQYFTMRKRQFSIIKQMLPIIARINKRDEMSLELALFFVELSEAVHPGDTSIIFIHRLQELNELLKNQPLPKTEETFQLRASITQLLFLLETYFLIKANYLQTQTKTNKKRRDGTFHSRLPF